MNIKKDSYFIAFITILILNMLLIFFGVFSYFFGVKDYTIIAGIIAFLGAIIGGSITLIGVNKTILEGRRKDEIDSVEVKLLICKKVKGLTSNMLNHLLNSWDNDEIVRTTFREVATMFEGVDDIPLFLLGKDVVETADSLNKSIRKLRRMGIKKEKDEGIDFEKIRKQMYDEISKLDTLIEEKGKYIHDRYFEL